MTSSLTFLLLLLAWPCACQYPPPLPPINLQALSSPYSSSSSSPSNQYYEPAKPDPSMSQDELNDLKWWKDKTPSMLKSRWDHRLHSYKRPPNLLSPGVFNFRKPTSTTYYFHNQGARIIKSSHFMKRYHLGRKISFVCVARGVPRPQITWLKDGLELNSYAGYEAVGISEWRQGRGRIKSKLEIDPAMPKDAGFYECQTDNKFAIDRRGFIAKYELN